MIQLYTNDEPPITSFRGRYEFLSNFYPCRIALFQSKEVYASVEHAFQALKFHSPRIRQEIRQLPSPGVAKYRSKELVHMWRGDWHDIKLGYMLNLLRKKFSISQLERLLLQTGQRQLIEQNYWHDTYWGVCDGRGHNHLGKLLMIVRKELVDTKPGSCLARNEPFFAI